MRKVIICILVLVGLFSCSEKIEEPKISKELIDLACQENIKQKEIFDSKRKTFIKHHYSIDIFAKLNNGKYVETNFYELLKIYEKSFKNLRKKSGKNNILLSIRIVYFLGSL